ncbi:S8 family serine peptidase [Mitsuaria sp. GD03876]|uniref:S8 family peptidase n=1 Tax=Mitsuaria sp. GD03876 TaxID=2975399 RepID=UPI00244D500B|nr:S8 family serine peptidase [Mitsuaria sp. GD03876]MDH0863997.1 S8 family serine peptidase [Mitsuaria sp. GD03876]
MASWIARVAGVAGAALVALLTIGAPARAEETSVPASSTEVTTSASLSTTASASTMLSPDGRYVILAVEDRGEPLPGAGGSPRGDYRRMVGYAGSARAEAISEAVAREYGLREQAAWTIAPLNLRCMLYALAEGADADAVLARLRQDERVKLAQPLNEFETLGDPSAPPAARAVPSASSQSQSQSQSPSSMTSPAAAAAPEPTQALYNDPYFGLQKGFQQMSTAALQQVSTGARVKVAVIDTGVDASHPDLAGQLSGQRDYVAGGGALVDAVPERHGTEVAGLIAARVNNRQGIVGVAPGAAVTSYRACWSDAARADGAGPAPARCNSFTLAQALGAAIADGADVINLSLGGPSDPLLTKLARHAQSRGAVLVAAAPPGRLGKGFPSEVPGAIVVASAGDAPDHADWLAAPGRAVLTTVPGGGYDVDTGSSLAAAHATGVIALLRAAVPGADAQRLRQALMGSMSASGAINACAAARSLGVAGVRCDGASTDAAANR